MAKKKSRRSGRGEGDTAVDTASTASTSTLASLQDFGNTADTAEDLDPFETNIEALYEKRASTRERALSNLIGLMEGSYCFDDCSYRQETMSGLFVGCLRKGGTAEASLAIQALLLLALTLGLEPATQQLLSQASILLQKIAVATGKDLALRRRAVEALALLTFVAAEDQEDVDKILSGLANIAQMSGPALLAASAIRGWSLLLTSLPGWRLDSAFCDGALGFLSQKLADSDVELRTAAGEAVALLFSLAGLGELDPGIAGDEDEAAAEDSGALGEVVERMQALATNKAEEGFRRSRRDKATTKAAFRDLWKVVQEGEHSPEKVKLRHGDALVTDTFAGRVQLNYLRAQLGRGFQMHIQDNPLLHDIFNFEPATDPQERMTPHEKRMARAPASKSRSIARKADRFEAAAYKSGMMTAGSL